ncbi:MAG: zinc ribbon domain-containing protein [Clostridiales bacterium]|nr:zinc ribbon domain-containing protein [Clostridiales bacterium]
MYCEKCGAENKADAAFCEGWGNKIKASQAPERPAIPMPPEDTSVFNETELLPSALKGIKTKIKKPALTKKHKTLIIAAAALIIVLVGLISTASAMSKPERLVEKYFEDTLNGNWEKVYEYLDVKDEGFTSKANFLALKEIDGETDFPEITNFSVKERKSSASSPYFDYNDTDENAESDALTRTFTVTYTIKGMSSPPAITISLVKQKGKQFLFFDEYKIAADDYVIPEYTFTVLKGATLYIDGTQVGSEFLSTKPSPEDTDYYSDMDIYKINGIFAGAHKIKVTTPVTADYEKTAELSSYSPAMAVADAVVSTSEVGILQQDAPDTLISLYNHATAMKSFDEFKQSQTLNEENIDEIRSQYEDFCNKICKPDGSMGITEISFSNFIFDDSEARVNEKLLLTVRMNFEYNFTAYRNVLYNEMYSNSYPYNGSAAISYIYSDGAWKINSFKNIAVNY